MPSAEVASVERGEHGAPFMSRNGDDFFGLVRCDPDNCAPTRSVLVDTLATNKTNGHALAADDNVYAVHIDGTITRVPVYGCNVETLGEDPAVAQGVTALHSIATTGETLLWTRFRPHFDRSCTTMATSTRKWSTTARQPSLASTCKPGTGWPPSRGPRWATTCNTGSQSMTLACTGC